MRSMKKTFIILCFLSTLLSCSNDDVVQTPSSDSVDVNRHVGVQTRAINNDEQIGLNSVNGIYLKLNPEIINEDYYSDGNAYESWNCTYDIYYDFYSNSQMTTPMITTEALYFDVRKRTVERNDFSFPTETYYQTNNRILVPAGSSSIHLGITNSYGEISLGYEISHTETYEIYNIEEVSSSN